MCSWAPCLLCADCGVIVLCVVLCCVVLRCFPFVCLWCVCVLLFVSFRCTVAIGPSWRTRMWCSTFRLVSSALWSPLIR